MRCYLLFFSALLISGCATSELLSSADLVRANKIQIPSLNSFGNELVDISYYQYKSIKDKDWVKDVLPEPKSDSVCAFFTGKDGLSHLLVIEGNFAIEYIHSAGLWREVGRYALVAKTSR